MAGDKVLTGAIALIKVDGKIIGKMRSVSVQEQMQRQEIRGIGTIIPSEAAVTAWTGTLSCEFMSVSFKDDGIKNAIRRGFNNVLSQASSGTESFEDQLVLDSEGVQVDIYKKVADIIDADGNIKPKITPYAIVRKCLIESDSFQISDGGIAGHNQSFRYLIPVSTV